MYQQVFQWYISHHCSQNKRDFKKSNKIIITYYPCRDFPGSSVIKNQPTNTGDAGSISGSGRSPGEGNGNPLQCSCLENPMDRGAWWAAVHGLKPELDTTEPLNSNACRLPSFFSCVFPMIIPMSLWLVCTDSMRPFYRWETEVLRSVFCSISYNSWETWESSFIFLILSFMFWLRNFPSTLPADLQKQEFPSSSLWCVSCGPRISSRLARGWEGQSWAELGNCR